METAGHRFWIRRIASQRKATRQAAAEGSPMISQSMGSRTMDATRKKTPMHFIPGESTYAYHTWECGDVDPQEWSSDILNTCHGSLSRLTTPKSMGTRRQGAFQKGTPWSPSPGDVVTEFKGSEGKLISAQLRLGNTGELMGEHIPLYFYIWIFNDIYITIYIYI